MQKVLELESRDPNNYRNVSSLAVDFQLNTADNETEKYFCLIALEFLNFYAEITVLSDYHIEFLLIHVTVITA